MTKHDDIVFMSVMMMILSITSYIVVFLHTSFFPLVFSIIFTTLFRLPYRFMWMYYSEGMEIYEPIV
jgi:predicted PurR-regulated permease PerM